MNPYLGRTAVKPRHILPGLAVAVLVAWTLASCNLLTGVSIKDRVANLQDDMNTSTRSNVYKNFHPTESISFAALRTDPSTFNQAYPPANGPFSLSVVDDSDSSAVIVKVGAGDSVAWTAPWYMELQMDKSGDDWDIVKLYDAQNNGGYTIRFP